MFVAFGQLGEWNPQCPDQKDAGFQARLNDAALDVLNGAPANTGLRGQLDLGPAPVSPEELERFADVHEHTLARQCTPVKHSYAQVGVPRLERLCLTVQTVPMASDFTPGQQAALLAAKARRGELGLNQKQLAEKAGVHYRTIQDFERGLSWPHQTTLAKIEKLGLDLPVGHFEKLAASEDGLKTESRDARVARIQGEIERLRAEVGELLDQTDDRGRGSEDRKAS